MNWIYPSGDSFDISSFFLSYNDDHNQINKNISATVILRTATITTYKNNISKSKSLCQSVAMFAKCFFLKKIQINEITTQDFYQQKNKLMLLLPRQYDVFINILMATAKSMILYQWWKNQTKYFIQMTFAFIWKKEIIFIIVFHNV